MFQDTENLLSFDILFSISIYFVFNLKLFLTLKRRNNNMLLKLIIFILVEKSELVFNIFIHENLKKKLLKFYSNIFHLEKYKKISAIIY